MILVSKFDKVNVSWQSRVSKDDLLSIERITCSYEAVKNQLLCWKEYIQSAPLEVNPKLRLSTENFRGRKYPYITVREDYSATGAMDLSRNMFSPAYSLKYINESLCELAAKRNKLIQSYLNKTHSVSIDLDESDLDLEPINEFMNSLLKSLGDLSFEEYGLRELKYLIGRYEAYKPSQQKSKVVFTSVWLTDRELWDTNNSGFFQTLIGILSLMEGNGNNRSMLLDALGRKPSFTAVSIGGTKLSGFRYFKNRKLELTFTSPEAAGEFLAWFL